jgi:hypothetical protein
MKRELIVEGNDDLRVIPFLVEASGVNWEIAGVPIVQINQFGGRENILAQNGRIETRLKLVTHLGILLDADENAQACWDSIRNREKLKARYSEFPSTIPKTGFIARAADEPKFGVWIMPDNTSRGMLETFLLHLRPTSPLLEYSAEVVAEAKKRGAPFSEANRDKAQIHTWLAWQDPPGQQLHNAIQQKMLTEKSQLLTDFLAWFCDLYDLPRKIP